MDYKDYEILVFMSDQHNAMINGFMGDPVVRTPNLDALAAEGVVFDRAYTSCPLCVPARSSFVTLRYPFDLGIGDNNGVISSSEPTFLHALDMAGYETVRIGRMHFNGKDQLHGFDKWLGKDICTAYPGLVFTGERGLHKDYSSCKHHGTYPAEDCASLLYDNYVVDIALDYLEQTHEKKQAIVVGTYMPHWPLGAPEEKVAYYRDKVEETRKSKKLDHTCPYLPWRFAYKEDEADKLNECRAAYYAMVEEEDTLIGKVYKAFRKYLEKKGSKGIFIYLSDHGDHAGEKMLDGKQTFFEASARIPMLVAGDGIKPGRVETPVSIMDIGETLCSITGASHLEYSEGIDLSPAFEGKPVEERPIISELLGNGRVRGEKVKGTMVLKGRYKYITYTTYEDLDLLFDVEADPEEEHNIINEHPEIAAEYRSIAEEHNKGWEYTLARIAENAEFGSNHSLMMQWGQKHPEINDDITWVFGKD